MKREVTDTNLLYVEYAHGHLFNTTELHLNLTACDHHAHLLYGKKAALTF